MTSTVLPCAERAVLISLPSCLGMARTIRTPVYCVPCIVSHALFPTHFLPRTASHALPPTHCLPRTFSHALPPTHCLPRTAPRALPPRHCLPRTASHALPPWLVGATRAMHHSLSAAPISAAQAEQWGLVSDLPSVHIASHRIASHRIASHRIASYRIASPRISSHLRSRFHLCSPRVPSGVT